MILDKKILSELLGRAMSSGADFAEVFAEHTRHGLVVLSGGAVDELSDRFLSGVCIRVLRG